MLAAHAAAAMPALRRAYWAPGSGAAVAAIALFYTGTTVFLYNRGLVTVAPVMWLAALALLALPALAQASRRVEVGRLPVLVVWFAHFGVIVLAYLAAAETDATDRVFRDRVLAAALLVVLVLLLADGAVLTLARQTLGFTAVFATCLNLVDVVRPLTFSETYGRSAGLYENPNRSSAAIVLAAVLAWDVVPARWRPAFLTTTAVGTFVTLSRAGILTFCLFLGLLAWRRLRAGAASVPWRALGRSAAVALAVLAVILVWQHLPAASALRADPNVAARLEWFRTPTLEDDAAVQRVTAAGEAWDLFGDRPLRGYGLGSSREGDLAIGTHNVVLSMLVEFGIGGGLLAVALIGAAFVRSPRAGSASRYAGTILFLWAMVNHNVFEDWLFVIAIAVAAAVAYSETLRDA